MVEVILLKLTTNNNSTTRHLSDSHSKKLIVVVREETVNNEPKILIPNMSRTWVINSGLKVRADRCTGRKKCKQSKKETKQAILAFSTRMTPPLIKLKRAKETNLCIYKELLTSLAKARQKFLWTVSVSRSKSQVKGKSIEPEKMTLSWFNFYSPSTGLACKIRGVLDQNRIKTRRLSRVTAKFLRTILMALKAKILLDLGAILQKTTMVANPMMTQTITKYQY